MAYIGKVPAVAALTASDITDGIISNAKLAQDIISGDTALGATPADTDEFLVSDAGTLKRVDYSYIKGGGITEADQWRLTTNFSLSTSDAFITSNLERIDTSPQDKMGTGMSESSGVFTFPSTGYWWVIANMQFANDDTDSRYMQFHIQTTTDNSTYTKVAEPTGYMEGAGGWQYLNIVGDTLIDVTNVSNVKVKFSTVVATSSTAVIYGSSTANRTYFTFIRLGDT